MKRFSYYSLLFVSIVLYLNSCTPIEDKFDETLLIGTWEREYYHTDLKLMVKEYYRYDANKNGATWVPAEDITEAEAQGFTWTLVNSTLTQVHIMQIGGGGIPKVYTVTELSSTTLKYKDDFKNTYVYQKVIK